MTRIAQDIFISYRRQDTSGIVGRLRDRLVATYSKEHIFMDTESINLGDNFIDRVERAAGNCKIMLVIIGKNWDGFINHSQKSRFRDPKDVVRREVEFALARKIPLIPILIDGAPFPRKENLPDTMAELEYRQSYFISHETFERDYDKLLAELKIIVNPQEHPYAVQTTQENQKSLAKIIKEGRLPRFFVSGRIEDRYTIIGVYNLLVKSMALSNRTEGYSVDDCVKSFSWLEEDFRSPDYMLCFIGEVLGSRQLYHLSLATHSGIPIKLIWLSGIRRGNLLPKGLEIESSLVQHVVVDAQSAEDIRLGCVEKIIQSLRYWWVNHFDSISPNPPKSVHIRKIPHLSQLFDYEKNVIEFYAAMHGHGNSPTRVCKLWPQDKIMQTLARGAPLDWPEPHRELGNKENPLDPKQVGEFRGPTQESSPDSEKSEVEGLVRAAALMDLDRTDKPLAFPEAGPRQSLALPPDDGELNVAILVAGGIAPGINAVVDAIVQRHAEYEQASKEIGNEYTNTIIGIRNGLLGINDGNIEAIPLTPDKTRECATLGGSMLGTSRDDRLLSANERDVRIKSIVETLSTKDIDVLYVIGGDGGMKAAHILWHFADRHPKHGGRKMAVVAIPKTMDNDILWVWQSFGFLSAVDELSEICRNATH